MGANSSESSWINERYQYIQTVSLSEYGVVSVFKKKEENYDYIALMSRAAPKEYLKELKRELCFLTGKRISLPFLKIFEVTVGEQPLTDSIRSSLQGQKQQPKKAICSIDNHSQFLSIYIQLLTYTLKDYINYKKQSKYEISLKEYSYILKTALSAAQIYEQWRLTYLELDLLSELMFLKPNGEIKLLPFRSRFLKEIVNDCQCITPVCNGSSHIIKNTKHEFQTSSYLTKKKESKCLKQLKELSLELYSTINPHIDPFVRSIPNFNRDILLSQPELNLLKNTQAALINSKSLAEVYNIIKDVQDDFLLINRFEQSTAEVEINNPQTYHAFIQHLNTLNSFKKETIHEDEERKYLHVTRKIFEIDSVNESQSNTLSNPSPKYSKASQNSSLKAVIYPEYPRPQ